jgi:hypothetical protein
MLLSLNGRREAMKIQSQRAKEIDSYIDTHDDAEIAKWPIEISGKKQIRPFYGFPISLLRYNANNGRLAMEKQQWESENGRQLDSSRKEDAVIVRDMLLELDPDKTKYLKADLRQKGQIEPGIITHDGFVINGNRRMAIFEELHKEEPTGKWEYLEAVRLPPTIGEPDLWRIEAGLQLSKDKVAEYHPVNELLKIRQGIATGLSPREVAAAMYGRTEQEVKEAMKRLELIDNFLDFFGQSGNYGLIKAFGLHEYFIDIQKSVIAPAERESLPKRQLAKRLEYAFALVRAGILIQSRGKTDIKGITHWDVRKLGKIFPNVHASSAYLEHLKPSRKITSVPEETVIEDFRNAVEVLDMQEQRGKPVRLIERAIKALESIDRESDHFREEPVREAIERLSKLVLEIEEELS